MKKIFLITILVNCCLLVTQAQKPGADSVATTKEKTTSSFGIGIKAGLNFSNVTNASSINGHSQTGFHAGLFFGGSTKHILTSRTELLYSQQGFQFSTDTASGSNSLNYIMLAQLLAINITHFVQIQFGVQMGYLLNANVSSSLPTTGIASADKILDLYNRFDYGFAGGVEIHPIAGLLIGARYNISLNNLYKEAETGSTSVGTINFKNNVVQFFVGYRF
jgi:hypothetical protein